MSGKQDIILIGDAGADGEGVGRPVLRQRDDRIEVGELRELVEGRPLAGGGELVRLRPRSENGRLFDVEVLAELPAPARDGPPQVASEAYRRGWDETFGSRDAN